MLGWHFLVWGVGLSGEEVLEAGCRNLDATHEMENIDGRQFRKRGLRRFCGV
jgi:hypothetical protein